MTTMVVFLLLRLIAAAADDDLPSTAELIPRGIEIVSPTSNIAGFFMLEPQLANDRPVYRREGMVPLFVYHVVSGESVGRWMIGQTIGQSDGVRARRATTRA